MDTDVLLHNSLDELLQYGCWLAQEDIRYISTGLGFGAEKEHCLLRLMMESYENSVCSGIINTMMDVKAIEQYLPNWEKKETSQTVDDVYILRLKDYSLFAHHLATISWQDKEVRLARQKVITDILSNRSSVHIRRKRLIFRIKRKLHSPKIIAWFDKRKGSRLERIYTFLTYDFLDYGPFYFAKRLLQKLFK